MILNVGGMFFCSMMMKKLFGKNLTIEEEDIINEIYLDKIKNFRFSLSSADKINILKDEIDIDNMAC